MKWCNVFCWSKSRRWTLMIDSLIGWLILTMQCNFWNRWFWWIGWGIWGMVKVIVWNVKRRVLNLKRATSHGLCIFVSYQSTDDSYDVLSTVMLNSFQWSLDPNRLVDRETLSWNATSTRSSLVPKRLADQLFRQNWWRTQLSRQVQDAQAAMKELLHCSPANWHTLCYLDTI